MTEIPRFTLTTGDRVRVSSEIVGQGNMASHLPHHGEVVTIVAYWRNGKFIVREDRHQTTVAISARYLTKLDPERAAVERAIADGTVQADWDRQA